MSHYCGNQLSKSLSDQFKPSAMPRYCGIKKAAKKRLVRGLNGLPNIVGS